MEKTYLRVLCVEVMERLARCESLLTRLADTSARDNRNVLNVVTSLQARLAVLENKMLEERELLVSVLTDTGSQAGPDRQALARLFQITYQALGQLSQIIARIERGHIQPELHLFLKDSLPDATRTEESALTVVVDAEGKNASFEISQTLSALQMDHVQFAWLSVLQQDNPLAWVSLNQQPLAQLAKSLLAIETPEGDKLDKTTATLVQRAKKEVIKATDDDWAQTLLQHSLGLRLFGPAYYFQMVSQALLENDLSLLALVENTLFYGLNHFNIAHNQTVILHEAADRLLKEQGVTALQLPQNTLGDWFKITEKAISDRYAFGTKHLERAMQLKERLAEGILLSSASVFPMQEVAQAFDKAALSEVENKTAFPIYQLLSMTTEYPHTPREIVNAGWLHKVERGAVWVFAALQEAGPEATPQAPQLPYQKLAGLFSAQDHLLSKSIETAELHRVLLCTPETATA